MNPPCDGRAARCDVHFDGDRQVHVVKVEPDKLTLDPRFQLDFNTAFPTGPARPHGIAMK
jgi:hypothetical protein